MNLILKGRGLGKTSELIRMSSETGFRIVTMSPVKHITILAEEMGFKIPTPVRFKDYRHDGKPVLVDEIESILKELLGAEIVAATCTPTGLMLQL